MRTAVVAGYPLAFDERGSGPPPLLVHGSVNDLRAWHHQMPAFAAHFRTIAVSLRHCWPERWDGRGGTFTVARHVADLAGFIDQRALGPMHVVGHSRGGAVALQLALTHPAHVQSLVLADPGGLEALLPDTAEGRAMATESSTMFAALAADLAQGDAERAARAFVDALGGPGAWDRRRPEQKAILLDNIATGPHCAERPRFTVAALRALTMPLLLVTGARSPARYAIMLHALRGLYDPPPPVVVVPDAAHAMNRENPAVFNAAVLAFLSGVAPRAGP